MRLFTEEAVQDFQYALEKCKGAVWLEDRNGSRIDLKSKLSQYVAIGRLLTECSAELELYCSRIEDESIMLNFFNKHNESL